MCIATSNRNTDDPARQCSIAVCFPLEDKKQLLLRPDIVHRVYESVNQVRYTLICFVIVTATINNIDKNMSIHALRDKS